MLIYLVQDILKYIFFSVNYMQSTSCRMLDWLKHTLESRLLGEISITSDMQMAENGRTKEPLDESERVE